MRTIWKYELKPEESGPDLVAEVELPVGALIRRLDVQNDKPHIWVEIDDERQEVYNHLFYVYPTGVEVGATKTYLGTFALPGIMGLDLGETVWHVYE